MNKGRFPKLWSVIFRSFYSARIPSLGQPFVKVYRLSWISQVFKPSLLAFMPTVLAIQAVGTDEKQKKEAREANIIKTADELYDSYQFDKLYELLQDHKDTDNPYILWRLARVVYEKSKKAANDSEKLNLLEQALAYVSKSLEINDDIGPAHKWMAIILDSVLCIKSTKSRLQNCLRMRKHMERAIELSPKDGTSYYILGEWCYAFADLPWYQRKIAALIFATPPESSYEEAYFYFSRAEEVDPGFYSMNLLMCGQCLLKMNDKENAIKFLKKTLDYPIKTDDDKKAHEEALKLLKKHGAE